MMVTKKTLKKLKIGDVLKDGNVVLGKVKVKTPENAQNIKMTNIHLMDTTYILRI